MKKRIAFLCSGYPAVSHTFIFREIQELRKRGFEIYTASINPFVSWPNISYEEKRDAENTFYIKKLSIAKIIFSHFILFINSPFKYWKGLIISVRLVLLKGPKSLKKAIGYFTEAGALAHWLKKNKICHTHIHFPNPAATVALIAVEMYKFEFSLSVHGPDIFYNVEENLLAEKLIAAKFVRSISHFCSSQIMRLIPLKEWGKVYIIHCSVGLADFSFVPAKDKGILSILCVGRLTKNKGQSVLLQACAQLKKRGRVFKLTFVGDGEDRETLETITHSLYLDSYVSFTGSIGQSEVQNYYHKADLFVLPSFAEGVPVVLMEAMAIGLPVISTKITGIPELIEDGVNGFLVFPSDINGLAEKIELFFEGLQDQKSMRKCARKTIEDGFHMEKNGQLLFSLFERNLPL